MDESLSLLNTIICNRDVSTLEPTTLDPNLALQTILSVRLVFRLLQFSSLNFLSEKK